MDKRKLTAVLFAVLAALFYAINMPASKLLLLNVAPTVMAALLYLGAGAGIGAMYLFSGKDPARKLTKTDLPYVTGMILLDILAPILLMLGLTATTSANASLLNNFEIAATSLIAMIVFREKIPKRLWIAIALVTLSSVILSLEDMSGLKFSSGSVLVLLAALCWGFENNCTRMISSKNTYEIVMLKGIFSGLGALAVAFITGESLPKPKYIAAAMILGFTAYGLSIFFYIKAQNVLGAAKTSTFYAIAPFAGAALSFVFLREAFTLNYFTALIIMLCGSALAAADTLLADRS